MSGGAGPLALADDVAVDAPTARELLEEIHRRITQEEIAELVALLEAKSAGFRARLGADVIVGTDEAALRQVLRSCFVSRRRVGAVLGVDPVDRLRGDLGTLLHGDGDAGTRLQAFCATVDLPEAKAAELGAELLHFCDPEAHPLWSRWIYSADTRTGALPLLVSEDYDLEADDIASGYTRVRVAIATVDDSPEASSFRPHGGGPLATDVFLACVYGVYMNTVLGLKMSQEFNALVPPLPQLARRLLGVQKMEV